ncbi:uncharacterized protein LOC128553075 [Mercenaria mercenaria]|uniref:uncharacterized protein LOC128553075 n=1 Tax=Mercenaria mercenaria TaxID=6596 RepID=UPI00234EB963|nr:uncharacterized protein LOC128553075 [Mercenaria mercenaria]
MSRENHACDHANVDNNNAVNIDSDSNYAHTYFELEPHVNESNNDNTTYDTSGNANKSITEQDNVYNRLELDNNKRYDHVHTRIRNGVLKLDDTYDTTDKAAMKLKARPGKDSDAFDETDEDAYNHITSKPVTNTKTVNEYGVPNTLENAYGDVVANNKNNRMMKETLTVTSTINHRTKEYTATGSAHLNKCMIQKCPRETKTQTMM